MDHVFYLKKRKERTQSLHSVNRDRHSTLNLNLSNFIEKFQFPTPLDLLKRTQSDCLKRNFLFLGKNYPLYFQANLYKVEILPIRQFFRFLSFTKLQFVYYLIERTIIEFLNLTSSSFSHIFLDHFNQHTRFSLKALPFVKAWYKPEGESLIIQSYLDSFFKNINRHSNNKFKTKTNLSLLKTFVESQVFRLSHIQLLFSFELLKQKSQFLVNSTDTRKIYVISAVKNFQDEFFQNFENLKTYFKLAFIVFSNQKKEFGFIPSRQSEKYIFCLYKNRVSVLLDFFSYNSNYKLYNFCPLTSYAVALIQHGKMQKCNPSIFNLFKSSFNRINQIKFLKRNESISFFEFTSVFFKVNLRELQIKMNNLLLKKLFEDYPSNFLETLLIFNYSECSKKSDLKIISDDSLNQLDKEFSTFYQATALESFFFDKLKKQFLIVPSNITYSTSYYFSDLGQVDFEHPFYFQLKLKNPSLLFRNVKKNLCTLALLNQPLKNSSHFIKILEMVQKWTQKHSLKIFKFHIFFMITSFNKDLIKNLELLTFTHLDFYSFYAKNVFLKFKNQKVLYWHPFGIFYFFLYQINLFLYLRNLRKVIKQNSSATQTILINKLALKILAYSYYSRLYLNEKSFKHLDSQLTRLLWKWSVRRHNNKNNQWIQEKYFFNLNQRAWFFGCLVPITVKDSLEKETKKFIYLPYHYQIFKILMLSQ